MKTSKVLDISFCAEKFDDIVKLILSYEGSENKLVVTPNVDFLVRYHKCEDFKDVVDTAWIRTPDGMPIVWASKLVSERALDSRVTGADLLPAICNESVSYSRTIFFLGGLEGVADRAIRKMLSGNPDIKFSGSYSPPFGFENDPDEIQRIIEIINSSKTDILFIGLGSPKQEFFFKKYGSLLNVKVTLCTGAAFDFIAETVKRAPLFVQKLGLEWLWRFFQEPRRMFKRYFVDDMYFFVLLIKKIFSVKG